MSGLVFFSRELIWTLFLDLHVILNMPCCKEDADCLLSWGFFVSIWMQLAVGLAIAWRGNR